jgi:hypothetical protein
MREHLFPRKWTRRDFIITADASTAGLAAARSEKNFIGVMDLARRLTVPNAEDTLAMDLGDGKEARRKTNRPDNRLTPHSLSYPILSTLPRL